MRERPDCAWLNLPAQALDRQVEAAARIRQDNLTKPPGALGDLELLAIRLAAMQGRELPHPDPVWISIFASDHGVTAEGVSAFPQAATVEMIKNFSRGGAAISVRRGAWSPA
jgi:nicotinate-nucleotide--dimethylbenzimidazole phosphoribosyltransferase